MSILIEVDLIIDQIDTEELEEELTRRRRRMPGEEDYVDEAIARLKQGDAEEALLLLERGRRPKWETIKNAQIAYARACTAGARR